jgi:uncharacterized protein (TIGR02594 family)
MNVTAFSIGQRFVGLKEVAGSASNPLILAMLRLDASWVQDDQTAWCSAWLNWVCWLLELPRSRSLAARSWLTVGRSIALTDAQPGFDVVVLSRGKQPQPDATVLQAPGHVGFYAGQDATSVQLLAGNQGDSVNVASFPKTRILSIRRLLG